MFSLFIRLTPWFRKDLVLKEKHSFRVCDEILNIGRKLDFKQKQPQTGRGDGPFS